MRPLVWSVFDNNQCERNQQRFTAINIGCLCSAQDPATRDQGGAASGVWGGGGARLIQCVLLCCAVPC